jgi:hypothetical protein
MNTRVQTLFESFANEPDHLRQAYILQQLRRDEEVPVKEIAVRIKKHQTYVSHLLRVVKLPEIVLDGYYSKQISFAHLIILSRLDDSEQIAQAYETVLAKSFSTAQTEVLIRQLKYQTNTVGNLLSVKECEKLVARAKRFYPEATFHIFQSQIRGKILIEVKGNAGHSSVLIQNIMNSLVDISDSESVQPEELMILE